MKERQLPLPNIQGSQALLQWPNGEIIDSEERKMAQQQGKVARMLHAGTHRGYLVQYLPENTALRDNLQVLIHESRTLSLQPNGEYIGEEEQMVPQPDEEEEDELYIYHLLNTSITWKEEKYKEVQKYLTKERFIKELVNNPALRDNLHAMIDENQALTQELKGGETTKALGVIAEGVTAEQGGVEKT